MRSLLEICRASAKRGLVLAAGFAAAISATAATAATAAAAAGTLFTRTSFVDGEGAAIEFVTVHGVDGGLGLFVGAHGDEAETTGIARDAVGDEADFSDDAVRGESVLEIVLGGVEGKVSDV